MARKLIVCCDGTWNKAKTTKMTVCWRLPMYSKIFNAPGVDETQLTRYQSGLAVVV